MDQASLPPLMMRLASFAGYQDVPTVCCAMTFQLPPFKLASSRLIRASGRVWEAWSPNSDRIEYYPGVPDARFIVETPHDPAHRRADGHLGRFDPTRSPQLLNHDRLWYPFIRLDRDADCSTHPEHTDFLEVWSNGEQSFALDFVTRLSERVAAVLKGMELHRSMATTHPTLWKDRPRNLEMSHTEALRTLTRYDAALDAYASVQREVKLTSAWSKMAQAIKDRPPSANPISTPVRTAGSGWMGAWINGASQEDAAWLLRLGIPCFVVHEAETYRERQVHAKRASYPSFTTLTAVHDALRNKPAADLAMEKQGWLLNLSDPDEWISKRIPPSTWLERRRSSSAGQGWRNDKFPSPPEVLSPFKEANGQILPPPVMGSGQHAGTWSLWVQDQVENYGLCLVRQTSTRRSNDMDGKHYYDREKRRCLVLDERAIPPFSYPAPVEKFGLPAPDVPYLSLKAGLAGKVYQLEPLSTWMYRSRDAKAADLDSIYAEAVFSSEQELELGAQMSMASPGYPVGDRESDYSPSSCSRPRTRMPQPRPPSLSPRPRSFVPGLRQGKISSQPVLHARRYIRQSRSRSPVRSQLPCLDARPPPPRRPSPPAFRCPQPLTFPRAPSLRCSRSPLRSHVSHSPARRPRSPPPTRAPSPSPSRRESRIPSPGPSSRPFAERLSSPPPQPLLPFQSAYSSRSSAFNDAWSRRHGMEIANRPGWHANPWDRLALPPADSRPAHLPPPIDPSPTFLLDAPPDPDPSMPPPADSRCRRQGRRR